MKLTFVMNDESVNSYGFRVLTDGIDTERFLKNPVALYMHARSRELLPIGKWIELKKEDGKLIGTLEFDEDDDFAVKLFKKCEKGILNGTSIGIQNIRVNETDDDVVVEACELQECSLVDIPSNANAVRLYGKNDVVNLSLELCNQLKEIDMPQDTNDTAELQALQTEVIESTFAICLANGTVNESQKAFYLNASKTDFKATHEHLKTLAVSSEKPKAENGKESEINLNALLEGDDETELYPERKDWTYLAWYKNDFDGLMRMQKENPKQFKKLLNSQRLSAQSDRNLDYKIEN